VSGLRRVPAALADPEALALLAVGLLLIVAGRR